MQAIILAAGMGRRLGEFTKNNTKCMVPVNGVKLIDRMLTQLAALHLQRVVIVVGYEGQRLRNYIGNRYDDVLRIEYVNNPVYDKTNNIYSLALAKEQLQEDDTLLIESDLIFDDSMFPLILDDPRPNLALVAKYETWMDGTMVCIDDDCNIVNFVPKKAFSYAETYRYYKTVNIYKFSREFSRHKYVPFLEAYTKAVGNNEYYEQVLRVITLLDKTDLKALPITTEKWYEIDDVQDLDIASALFADQPAERKKQYMRRYGGYWRFPGMLDFCYLVNPYFPSERMRDEMRANFDVLLTEYPSGMYVNSLLAGIIVNTALYSINIAIMGGASLLSLNKTQTVFSLMKSALAGTPLAGQYKLLTALAAAALIVLFLTLFLRTRMGLAIRATGNNPDMVRSSSINPAITTTVGLCIAGSFTALSGCLLAQYQKAADINIGQGMVTIALASLLIGSTVLGRGGIFLRAVGAVLGAIIFRLVYTVALRLDMPAFMLKLVSAVIVVLAISIPYLRTRLPVLRRRMQRKAG